MATKKDASVEEVKETAEEAKIPRAALIDYFGKKYQRDFVSVLLPEGEYTLTEAKTKIEKVFGGK